MKFENWQDESVRLKVRRLGRGGWFVKVHMAGIWG